MDSKESKFKYDGLIFIIGLIFLVMTMPDKFLFFFVCILFVIAAIILVLIPQD